MRTVFHSLVVPVCGFLVAVANMAGGVEESEPTYLIGQCMGVDSGDTFIVVVEQGRIRVRLAGARAPEAGQPFFEESRVAVVERAYLRELRVLPFSVDPDGTLMATAMVGGTDLSQAQVAGGLAWFEAATAADPNLQEHETTARRQKLGMWSGPSPEPPWEYLQRLEDERFAARPTPTPGLQDLAKRTRIGEGATIAIVGVPTPEPSPEDVTLTLLELFQILNSAKITVPADMLQKPDESPEKEN